MLRPVLNNYNAYIIYKNTGKVNHFFTGKSLTFGFFLIK